MLPNTIKTNKLVKIEHDLSSDDPKDCLYALRFCCIEKITNENIVKKIKDLKNNDKCTMYYRLSYSAIAALDILGIEKYTGDNVTIKEIINTVFYSK